MKHKTSDEEIARIKRLLRQKMRQCKESEKRLKTPPILDQLTESFLGLLLLFGPIAAIIYVLIIGK